jgi:selenocysteine lyase/cysteine desulfurase
MLNVKTSNIMAPINTVKVDISRRRPYQQFFNSMVMRCGALSLFLSLQKSMNVKGFLLPKLSCSPPRFSQSPTRAFNAAQSQSISSSPIVVQEAPLHFFNNAGASPSPPKVLETILAHLDLEVKEGGYGAAKIVQEDGRLDHVYDAVIKLINAASPMEVALVESATVAWTRAFYSMVDYILELELELEQRRGDTDININTNMNANILPPLEKVILVSEAEYAANIVAIVKFCSDQNRRHGAFIRWKIYVIPSTQIHVNVGNSNGGPKAEMEMESTGIIDVEQFRTMLAGEMDISRLQEVRLGIDKGNGNNEIKSLGSRTLPTLILDPANIVMVCVTHIPTNSGIINPVSEVGKLIDHYNVKNENTHTYTYGSSSSSSMPRIFYLVDACQSIGQIAVDVQEMWAHAISATGRKYLRGPRGTGFLYMKRDLADTLCPSEVDHAAAPISFRVGNDNDNGNGNGNSLVGRETLEIDIKYSAGARRFEYWESNVSAKLGLGAAIDHLNGGDVGIQMVERRIIHAASRLRKLLEPIENVVLYHNHQSIQLCGIVCFSVKGVESNVVKDAMGVAVVASGTCSENGDRFELSVVPRTSTPIDSSNTGTCDLVRASLSYFNTNEEIERFVVKLRCIIDSYLHL